MSSQLEVKENNVDDYVEVVLIGEVDICTSQKLKDSLYSIIESSNKNITVDCLDLNYIDSTGLGVFVGALKKVKQYDKKIVLKNLKANIKKLFLITGLDKLFVLEE